MPGDGAFLEFEMLATEEEHYVNQSGLSFTLPSLRGQ